MKKQLLLFISMLLPMVAMADDSGSCGTNVTYTYVSSTNTLTIQGSGAMTDYSYNSDVPWHSYRADIKTVVIKDGVTSIGDLAFSYCDGLTSITIPNSVTSIGSSAFYYCTGLTSIEIPNSVTSIGNYAFLYCNVLTSVTIPNSVTSIGAQAFSFCSGLTSIEIPNSVTSIRSSAFYGCSGLTSITIPNSVTSIGDDAFYGCGGLTSIEIPNSVTSIGSRAFLNCGGLTSIEIPNSVTSIGNWAFYGCSRLVSVTIGSGIKSIGFSAFGNCAELADVYCYAESVPAGSYAFYGSHIEYATLHVPSSSVNLYKETAPWSGFKEVVAISGVTPELEKCATPTISFKGGKLHFECETSDVTYHYTITPPSKTDNTGNDVEVGSSYTVQVYATKDGYQDSDIATQDIDIRGIKGDVNDDGDVTAQDASLILQKVAGK